MKDSGGRHKGLKFDILMFWGEDAFGRVVKRNVILVYVGLHLLRRWRH